MNNCLRIAAAAFFLFFFQFAIADGHMNKEQSAVWEVVAASWVDDAGETGKWPGEYLHEDAFAWSVEWPVPRGPKSVASWSRFSDEGEQTLKYELFPMEITVVGSTAVAHYAVVSVTENSEGKRTRASSGITETLAKVDGDWKYVGLASFNIGDDD